MFDDDDDELWVQFRRFLLGTVVEVFAAHDLHLDVAGLQLDFDRQASRFHYPALNSELCFIGSVHAPLLQHVQDTEALERAAKGIWPEIVRLVRLPVFGAMKVERNQVEVEEIGGSIVIRFDLEAR